MSYMELEALDRLFFRDGKPFGAGENHWAQGRAFVPATALYGALRSQLLLAEAPAGQEQAWLQGPRQSLAQQLVGSDTEPGSLRLKGPWWNKQGMAYFTAPADVQLAERTWQLWQPLQQAPGQGSLDEMGLLPLVPSKYAPGKPGKYLLSEKAMQACLGGNKQGTFDANDCVKAEDLFEFEDSTGIGLQAGAKTVEEGQLYNARMLRPKNGVTLALELGPEPLPEVLQGGLMRLGGEGRAVMLKPAQRNFSLAANQFKEALVRQIGESKRFKWVLLSQASLGGPGKPAWLPAWLSKQGQGWQGEVPRSKGCQVKLVAARLERLEWQSGWDMALQAPKASRRLVPAGSVYFFELLEGKAEHLLQAMHFECLSDYLPEAGYGLGLLGGWNYAG